MADISTEADAAACVAAGADCLSTTLSGYTPETKTVTPPDRPNLDLVACLADAYDLPVFAEGRFNAPAWAGQAISNGAWSVVVGSAITRTRHRDSMVYQRDRSRSCGRIVSAPAFQALPQIANTARLK